MQAYSLDLRQRIIDACNSGQTEREVAQRFAVSLGSVQRYKRRLKQRATLEQKPWPGRAPKIKNDQKEALKQLVAADSNATLESLAEAWFEKHGIEVTLDVMSKTLARFGITHKKRVGLPQNVTHKNAKTFSKL